MRGAGVGVRDDGDLPTATWRAHRGPDEPNDAERVTAGLRDVRDRVGAVLERGERPLVLGGECTVTIGVVAATSPRRCASRPTVLADPEEAARRALAVVGDSPFVLHFDADVLDYLTLPAADIPTYGRGLDPATLGRALRVLGAGPGLRALVCAEVNPDHADEQALRGVVTLLTGALASV